MDISETFKKITEELNEKEQLVLKSMISGDTIEGTAKKLNIPKTHASSYRSTIYEIVGQYTDLGHGQNKQTALMNFMAGYESEINDRKEKVVEDLIKRNAELEKKNNCLNIELDSLRKFKEKVTAA